MEGVVYPDASEVATALRDLRKLTYYEENRPYLCNPSFKLIDALLEIAQSADLEENAVAALRVLKDLANHAWTRRIIVVEHTRVMRIMVATVYTQGFSAAQEALGIIRNLSLDSENASVLLSEEYSLIPKLLEIIHFEKSDSRTESLSILINMTGSSATYKEVAAYFVDLLPILLEVADTDHGAARKLALIAIDNLAKLNPSHKYFTDEESAFILFLVRSLRSCDQSSMTYGLSCLQSLSKEKNNIDCMVHPNSGLIPFLVGLLRPLSAHQSAALAILLEVVRGLSSDLPRVFYDLKLISMLIILASRPSSEVALLSLKLIHGVVVKGETAAVASVALQKLMLLPETDPQQQSVNKIDLIEALIMLSSRHIDEPRRVALSSFEVLTSNANLRGQIAGGHAEVCRNLLELLKRGDLFCQEKVIIILSSLIEDSGEASALLHPNRNLLGLLLKLIAFIEELIPRGMHLILRISAYPVVVSTWPKAVAEDLLSILSRLISDGSQELKVYSLKIVSNLSSSQDFITLAATNECRLLRSLMDLACAEVSDSMSNKAIVILNGLSSSENAMTFLYSNSDLIIPAILRAVGTSKLEILEDQGLALFIKMVSNKDFSSYSKLQLPGLVGIITTPLTEKHLKASVRSGQAIEILLDLRNPDFKRMFTAELLTSSFIETFQSALQLGDPSLDNVMMDLVSKILILTETEVTSFPIEFWAPIVTMLSHERESEAQSKALAMLERVSRSCGRVVEVILNPELNALRSLLGILTGTNEDSRVKASNILNNLADNSDAFNRAFEESSMDVHSVILKLLVHESKEVLSTTLRVLFKLSRSPNFLSNAACDAIVDAIFTLLVGDQGIEFGSIFPVALSFISSDSFKVNMTKNGVDVIGILVDVFSNSHKPSERVEAIKFLALLSGRDEFEGLLYSCSSRILSILPMAIDSDEFLEAAVDLLSNAVLKRSCRSHWLQTEFFQQITNKLSSTTDYMRHKITSLFLDSLKLSGSECPVLVFAEFSIISELLNLATHNHVPLDIKLGFVEVARRIIKNPVDDLQWALTSSVGSGSNTVVSYVLNVLYVVRSSLDESPQANLIGYNCFEILATLFRNPAIMIHELSSPSRIDAVVQAIHWGTLQKNTEMRASSVLLLTKVALSLGPGEFPTPQLHCIFACLIDSLVKEIDATITESLIAGIASVFSQHNGECIFWLQTLHGNKLFDFVKKICDFISLALGIGRQSTEVSGQASNVLQILLHVVGNIKNSDVKNQWYFGDMQLFYVILRLIDSENIGRRDHQLVMVIILSILHDPLAVKTHIQSHNIICSLMRACFRMINGFCTAETRSEYSEQHRLQCLELLDCIVSIFIASDDLQVEFENNNANVLLGTPIFDLLKILASLIGLAKSSDSSVELRSTLHIVLNLSSSPMHLASMCGNLDSSGMAACLLGILRGYWRPKKGYAVAEPAITTGDPVDQMIAAAVIDIFFRLSISDVFMHGIRASFSDLEGIFSTYFLEEHHYGDMVSKMLHILHRLAVLSNANPSSGFMDLIGWKSIVPNLFELIYDQVSISSGPVTHARDIIIMSLVILLELCSNPESYRIDIRKVSEVAVTAVIKCMQPQSRPSYLLSSAVTNGPDIEMLATDLIVHAVAIEANCMVICSDRSPIVEVISAVISAGEVNALTIRTLEVLLNISRVRVLVPYLISQKEDQLLKAISTSALFVSSTDESECKMLILQTLFNLARVDKALSRLLAPEFFLLKRLTQNLSRDLLSDKSSVVLNLLALLTTPKSYAESSESAFSMLETLLGALKDISLLKSLENPEVQVIIASSIQVLKNIVLIQSGAGHTRTLLKSGLFEFGVDLLLHKDIFDPAVREMIYFILRELSLASADSLSQIDLIRSKLVDLCKVVFESDVDPIGSKYLLAIVSNLIRNDVIASSVADNLLLSLCKLIQNKVHCSDSKAMSMGLQIFEKLIKNSNNKIRFLGQNPVLISCLQSLGSSTNSLISEQARAVLASNGIDFIPSEPSGLTSPGSATDAKDASDSTHLGYGRVDVPNEGDGSNIRVEVTNDSNPNSSSSDSTTTMTAKHPMLKMSSFPLNGLQNFLLDGYKSDEKKRISPQGSPQIKLDSPHSPGSPILKSLTDTGQSSTPVATITISLGGPADVSQSGAKIRAASTPEATVKLGDAKASDGRSIGDRAYSSVYNELVDVMAGHSVEHPKSDRDVTETSEVKKERTDSAINIEEILNTLKASRDYRQSPGQERDKLFFDGIVKQFITVVIEHTKDAPLNVRIEATLKEILELIKSKAAVRKHAASSFCDLVKGLHLFFSKCFEVRGMNAELSVGFQVLAEVAGAEEFRFYITAERQSLWPRLVALFPYLLGPDNAVVLMSFLQALYAISCHYSLLDTILSPDWKIIRFLSEMIAEKSSSVQCICLRIMCNLSFSDRCISAFRNEEIHILLFEVIMKSSRGFSGISNLSSAEGLSIVSMSYFCMKIALRSLILSPKVTYLLTPLLQSHSDVGFRAFTLVIQSLGPSATIDHFKVMLSGKFNIDSVHRKLAELNSLHPLDRDERAPLSDRAENNNYRLLLLHCMLNLCQFDPLKKKLASNECITSLVWNLKREESIISGFTSINKDLAIPHLRIMTAILEILVHFSTSNLKTPMTQADTFADHSDIAPLVDTIVQTGVSDVITLLGNALLARLRSSSLQLTWDSFGSRDSEANSNFEPQHRNAWFMHSYQENDAVKDLIRRISASFGESDFSCFHHPMGSVMGLAGQLPRQERSSVASNSSPRIIVVCLSREFVKSPVCRIECSAAQEMVRRDEVSLVFLLLDDGYSAASTADKMVDWLKAFIGTRPCFPLWDTSQFRSNMSNVMRYIKEGVVAGAITINMVPLSHAAPRPSIGPRPTTTGGRPNQITKTPSLASNNRSVSTPAPSAAPGHEPERAKVPAPVHDTAGIDAIAPISPRPPSSPKPTGLGSPKPTRVIKPAVPAAPVIIFEPPVIMSSTSIEVVEEEVAIEEKLPDMVKKPATAIIEVVDKEATIEKRSPDVVEPTPTILKSEAGHVVESLPTNDPAKEGAGLMGQFKRLIFGT
jgi:hypothetical protein